MKLCMFVTVSPTGKTTTAALALIRKENRHSFEWCNRHSFEWCLCSFAKAFSTPPSLFITDSDDEIAAAVDIVSSPRDVWTGVVRQMRLYVRRHKWAARWVFGQFTAGCHSTQCAESNQAAKKASLRKNAKVWALMTHVERENVAGRDKAAISEEVLRMRQSITGGASIAVVRSLMNTLTPYAFKLVLEQAAQAVFYTSKECDFDDGEPNSIPRIIFEGCDLTNHQFVVTRTGNTTSMSTPFLLMRVLIYRPALMRQATLGFQRHALIVGLRSGGAVVSFLWPLVGYYAGTSFTCA